MDRYVPDGYRGTHGIQPTSLVAALGLSAVMVSGLVLSSPAIKKRIDKVFEGTNIPLAQPKPEPTPDPRSIVRMKTKPVPTPEPIDTSHAVAPVEGGDFTAAADLGSLKGAGTLPIESILPLLPIRTPAPVLTEATIDARYARDFQPLYPASEERAGREGLVTVRVLVGADGRVKRIERIAAASDAFFAATERQALARWRFRPATRDGAPVEAWREMTVRFRMPE